MSLNPKAAELAYQAQVGFDIEELRTVNRAGQSAIKSSVLLNGGGAVAMLAFIGHLVTASDTKITAPTFALSLSSFVIGVWLGGLAAGFTFLTALGRSSKLSDPERRPTPKWHRFSNATNLLAIACGAISLLVCFPAGCYFGYRSFVRLPHGSDVIAARPSIPPEAAAATARSDNRPVRTQTWQKAEILMLIQTIILFATGVVVAFYTIETRRMRAVAAAQFNVMEETLQMQLADRSRAAEPIFVWGGGSANDDHVQWEFTNEGGPISYVTIRLLPPLPANNVEPAIRPSDWLGSSRKGTTVFLGNISAPFRFGIGFRTRLGSVGEFHFSATRDRKPELTGSGWV